jgi:uncharacterized protein (TIGR02266 family)
MGNIYLGMSIGFGFILFCILMAMLWVVFRNLRNKMLPGNKKENIITPSESFNGENRQLQRMEINWPVTLEALEGVMRARTKDISLGGAFVICDNPLPLGMQFRLTIGLPGGQNLTLTSEVIWSNANVPEERIVFRGMGVRFIKNSPEERGILDSALSAYQEEKETIKFNKGYPVRPANGEQAQFPL